MSTRYLKKDNVILVGLAKNGSQTIKQIGLNNDGFQIKEQDKNTDKFINWDDDKLLILIPMREPIERGYSEMLEVAMVVGKENIEKKFIPKMNYFQNDVMKFFVENIMLDEKWKGVQIKFFDLSLLSTGLPKYLGWDIEIPYYNTANQNPKKVKLMEELKGVEIKPQEIDNLFFNGIKKSKYWIKL